MQDETVFSATCLFGPQDWSTTSAKLFCLILLSYKPRSVMTLCWIGKCQKLMEISEFRLKFTFFEKHSLSGDLVMLTIISVHMVVLKMSSIFIWVSRHLCSENVKSIQGGENKYFSAVKRREPAQDLKLKIISWSHLNFIQVT